MPFQSVERSFRPHVEKGKEKEALDEALPVLAELRRRWNELVSEGLGAAWPVGSIYTSIVSTNPATTLGFGTWTAFGSGRTLVGLDLAQAEFDTVEETGGAKTHTLLTAEMPAHTHTQDSHNHTQDAHTHTQNSHNHTQDSHNHTQDAHSHDYDIGTSDDVSAPYTLADAATTDLSDASVKSTTATNQATTATNQATTAVNQNATATNQATTATNQNTGGGGAHNNLQPYIVVYFWKRTA